MAGKARHNYVTAEDPLRLQYNAGRLEPSCTSYRSSDYDKASVANI